MWNSTPLDLDSFSDFRLGEGDQLATIQPQFFFAPLQDKPQDPILDAIKLAQASPAAKPGSIKDPALPKELAILTADLGELRSKDDPAESPRSRSPSPLAFWSSVFEGHRQAVVSALPLYQSILHMKELD
ncbi:hypothetical protein EST38_g784 [Candolleomyces aberdarensis]|uniref:Uncharacterized protein n=1 Tax=Candolleomyces aberdarensis TaxID=2316362 RepID=A0A4V1Q5B6_9AGAR|nr:hypothetical protein EST38_g784 [Candolleomyces aberdarensis]